MKDNKKNISSEMIGKYISDEIENINALKKKESNWKINEEYNSQIFLKEKEGE